MVEHRRLGKLRVSIGREDAPLRVLMYGIEGVGKTSWAAEVPSPIFLGEGGDKQLNVARLPVVQEWDELEQAVVTLGREKHPFKNLIIDTADHLEPICYRAVCRQQKKASIEDFGYGKGFSKALEKWTSLIAALDWLQTTTGMGLVILAHAKSKKTANPFGEDYDRFSLRVRDELAAKLKGWAQCVLFATFKIEVSKGEGRNARVKAAGGARWAYHSWSHIADAKNRYGLPLTSGEPKIELDFAQFHKLMNRPEAEIVIDLRADVQRLIGLLSDEAKAVAATTALAAETTALGIRRLTSRVSATLDLQEQAALEAAPDRGEHDESAGDDAEAPESWPLDRANALARSPAKLQTSSPAPTPTGAPAALPPLPPTAAAGVPVTPVIESRAAGTTPEAGGEHARPSAGAVVPPTPPLGAVVASPPAGANSPTPAPPASSSAEVTPAPGDGPVVAATKRDIIETEGGSEDDDPIYIPSVEEILRKIGSSQRAHAAACVMQIAGLDEPATCSVPIGNLIGFRIGHGVLNRLWQQVSGQMGSIEKKGTNWIRTPLTGRQLADLLSRVDDIAAGV